jgi:uncharacterized protein YbjT (DUF2867 family)
MSQKILVTGATGNVGREVARILREQKQPFRAAVVSEASARKLPAPDIEWQLLDFGDPQTYPVAFEGVDRLFLIRPPAISDIDRYIKPVLEYAASVGVQHVTFLSLLGAEKNRLAPHHKIEKLLMAGDMSFTLLRCGFFMQNLNTTHRLDIQEYDDLFIPAGRGKTAFIDVRDIAAVAVKTLTEPNHRRKAYPLTGSQALDYYQVASVFSDVLKREITYSDPSLFRFAWRMWRRGHPSGFVAVTSGIYLTTRFGLANRITPDTAELLGRPPIMLRQYVVDYADSWR